MITAPATGSGHGGARKGSGRKPRSDSVAVDVRERLVKAKADREEHLARLAKLEVAEKEGRLIPADQAAKSAQRAGMAIRDAMLSIPGREAAKLAAIYDEREIERLLMLAIRAELERVAEMGGGRAG